MSEPAAGLEIGPPTAADRLAWGGLYEGYAAFHHRPMPPAVLDVVFGWLLDPAHALECRLARTAAGPVGLAHFRAGPSPLRGAEVGFLNDLFVAPEARGQRVGEALLAELGAVGRTRGWPVIRWITAADNAQARTLYDRLAKPTAWVTYELTP